MRSRERLGDAEESDSKVDYWEKISMVACDRARKVDRLSALSAIGIGGDLGELSLRISLRARVFELHSSEETARTLNYYCYYCCYYYYIRGKPFSKG